MRYGLLITAVATVTVPGVVAMGGVVAHDRVAAGAAGAGTRASAVFEGTRAGPLTDAPTTVLSRMMTAGQQVMGMRLLAKAADAELATPYQGTEVISQAALNGRVTTASEVWHSAGGPTLIQTADGTSWSPASAVAVAVNNSSVGVFGLTKSLVTLLNRHYVAVYRGVGAADGRPATVVELYRFDGSVAARYWLDKQTAVPLRRQLFDTSENVISEGSFTRLQFGALAVPGFANSQQRQADQAAQPAWVVADSPAGFVASLGDKGWLLPAAMPGGLPLYAAASARIAGGEVADLEYSDGLYVVSLFAQRGTLAPDMPGWQPVRMAGKQAYASGHSVTWAAAGVVYTVIADAPPQTVTEVVGTLTPSGSPGLLGRLLHGFDRLVRWLNPFG